MSSVPTLFVSIACLADPDVVTTVHDLFAKAQRPERLSVGICLQADPDDERFDTLAALPRVRIDRLDYRDAKGPILARQRCELLLRDEDFYLQIDCHTRFFHHWDTILLEEYALGVQHFGHVVLSHYPLNLAEIDDPVQCALIGAVNYVHHVGTDSINLHGGLVPLPPQPQPCWGISAALLFMPARAKRAVPFDPNLHFGLHAAEEFLYSARLYTHGYRVITPTRHALATEYLSNRARIPPEVSAHYAQASSGWDTRTWSKVKYLLELGPLEEVDAVYRAALPDRRYGMGRRRFLFNFYMRLGLHASLVELFPWYRANYGHLTQAPW